MVLRIHRRVLFKDKLKSVPVNISNNTHYYFVSGENQLIDKGQIEAARVVISKEMRKLKLYSKRKKTFWMLVRFSVPFTKKSAQSRMGKGKGAIDVYKCYLNINSSIFKFSNINDQIAKNFYNLISSKLSFNLHVYKCNNSNLIRLV